MATTGRFGDFECDFFGGGVIGFVCGDDFELVIAGGCWVVIAFEGQFGWLFGIVFGLIVA